MLSMGRKHRNSSKKQHKPRFFFRAIKKHFTGTSYINISDYKFEIKQEVVESLKSNSQHRGNELCGVLTGSQVGYNRYRISKSSPPCVKKNRYNGCERDAAMANLFIEEDYIQSEHTRFYIGEWHTHPESTPTPSDVDYYSIRDNYRTASLVVPFLFMIIVGTQSFHISVYNGKDFAEVIPEIV